MSESFELSDDSDCEYEARRRSYQAILFEEGVQRTSLGRITQENENDIQFAEQGALSTSNSSIDEKKRKSSRRVQYNPNPNPTDIKHHIQKHLMGLSRKMKDFTHYRSWWYTPLIVFMVLTLLRKSLWQFDDQMFNYMTSHDNLDDSHHEPSINHVADVFSLFQERKDVPFLWTIPFSTEALSGIIMKCWSQKIADAASTFGFDTGLTVVTVPLHEHKGHINILLSPDLSMTSMFNDDHRGRLFTILKHPVYRSIDEYNYFQKMQLDEIAEDILNDHERLRAERIKTMSLDEYVRSDMVPDNFLTRQLCRISLDEQRQGWRSDYADDRELTIDDLQYAKEVLRRKCLVGVTTRLEEFIDRVLLYLHLKSHKHRHKDIHQADDLNKIDEESKKTCRSSILNDWKSTQEHIRVETSIDTFSLENDMIFQELMKKNTYDLQLYQYAEHLFDNEHGLINYKIRRQRPHSAQIDSIVTNKHDDD